MNQVMDLLFQIDELKDALTGRDIEIDSLKAQLAERDAEVAVLRHERNAERRKQERTIRILTGIHALLYPPRFTDNDGRTWQFKSPIVEEQMQELCDRIRAIPDEIEALAATEPKP